MLSIITHYSMTSQKQLCQQIITHIIQPLDYVCNYSVVVDTSVFFTLKNNDV